MTEFIINEKKELKIFTKDPEDLIQTVGEKYMNILAEAISSMAYIKVFPDKDNEYNLSENEAVLFDENGKEIKRLIYK